MNQRVLFWLSTVGLLLALLSTAALASGSADARVTTATIEAELLDVLSVEESSDFVVVMAEHADLSKAPQIEDWSERGTYVYDALREVATRSQAPVIAYVRDRGLQYRSFFSNNTVYVEAGDLEAVQTLAQLPGVILIQSTFI